MDRLANLLTMMRDSPDDPFLLFALALEYKSQGNLAESKGYFERLVNKFSDYVPTYYQYAKMEEENGNPEQAGRLYDAGIVKAKAVGDAKTARELQQAKEVMD